MNEPFIRPSQNNDKTWLLMYCHAINQGISSHDIYIFFLKYSWGVIRLKWCVSIMITFRCDWDVYITNSISYLYVTRRRAEPGLSAVMILIIFFWDMFSLSPRRERHLSESDAEDKSWFPAYLHAVVLDYIRYTAESLVHKLTSNAFHSGIQMGN